MKKTIIALCALTLLSGCYEISTGEKNGVITKLAQSGVFCKTWEMEIVRGGLTSGSGVVGAPFDVTIENPDLVKIAKQAIDTGAEIRIHYSREMVSFCRSDSDSTFLTSIEILRPGNATLQKAGAAASAASPASVPGPTGAQFQQMLDNQTKSIDQNERLLRIVEAKQAK